MKILMVISFCAFLIYGLEAEDCSDKLPAKMGINKYCKKLKQTCSKLETMCSEKLMDALGDENNAKKCKTALKTDAKKRVDTFCQLTCMKCAKTTEDASDTTTEDSTDTKNCEDLLPTEMGKGYCKKLNQSCKKLKGKCSKSLNVAIGNTNNAKKCKKALKPAGDEMVEMFCSKTCEACATTEEPSATSVEPPTSPPTGCKDEIPSMCDVNPESPLASCSQIIAYGEDLGMTLECMCDIYWRDINEPTLFKSSCDSMTPGQIKDNCQASCNMCQATETCDDGIKNQGEEKVDCGGPCAPCIETCDDGIKNQGEEKMDCGGPCAPCIECENEWTNTKCKNQKKKNKCKDTNKNKEVRANCMKTCGLCE